MYTNRRDPMINPLGWLAGLALLAHAGIAIADDPPTRVARLAYLEGSVSFEPAGTQEWVAPPVNRPLTTGDQLWADRGSRAELQLDGSLLRLGPDTAVSFLNLADHVTQVQVSSGTLIVNVRRLDEAETYEIDTPNVAFSVLRPGLYRVTVDPSGDTTAIAVRRGQGEATGGGAAYAVYTSQFDVFSGHDSLSVDPRSLGPDDDFDAWSDGRDRRWEHSISADYVSPDVIGYEDLDDQGTWADTPEYGYVWYPRGVDPGWAPYHEGHWAYIAPWGYTWVDDRPWGFAPFHYGRWVNARGAWGWIPGPHHRDGDGDERPVYAPALVAWVGVGAGVAWFALGPREVYVPSYPVSRGYVDRINVSNTVVNTTIINNAYNTTIVNHRTLNVPYQNRSVPGAVAAMTSQAFSSAQPVARNRLGVEARALAEAPVRALPPAAAPSRQAILGSGRSGAPRPPAAIENQRIIARSEPPQAQRSPRVQLAPPAHTLIGNAAPRAPQGMPRREPPRTAAPQGTEIRPPSYVHAGEVPQPSRPSSPNDAASVLERQHLQQQQALQNQQAAERQRVQQQQEQEHAQAARQEQQAAQQRAEEARRQQAQQLEQQHEQQTRELVQRQTEQQRQLQQHQEEERRQQPVQPPANAHGPEPRRPEERRP